MKLTIRHLCVIVGLSISALLAPISSGLASPFPVSPEACGAPTFCQPELCTGQCANRSWCGDSTMRSVCAACNVCPQDASFVLGSCVQCGAGLDSKFESCFNCETSGQRDLIKSLMGKCSKDMCSLVSDAAASCGWLPPGADSCKGGKDPTKSECVVEFAFSHKQITGKNTTAELNQSAASSFQCFTDLYKSIIPAHDPSKTTTGASSEALWKELLRRVGRVPGADYQKNKEFIDCLNGYYGAPPGVHDHNTREYIGGGQEIGNKGRNTPGCASGKLFLNERCELQKAADVTAQTPRCSQGAIQYTASIATPISLVWSDDYRKEPSTIVNFKLNPQSKSATWLWRGSASLPLLVYDPKHTGEITSAAQLFGSWSFGGKSATNGEPDRIPWGDGFEALATLDKDGDQRIAGPELEPIALWFDENRDAISQPGEVKPVSSVGVSALFYKVDSRQEGVAVASRGFERLLDGTLVTGAAVDWVEREIPDLVSLALDRAQSSPSVVGGENQRQTLTDSRGGEVSSSILGAWDWEVELPATGSGLLEFYRDADGNVQGTTFTQLGMKGISGVRGMVFFSHFALAGSANGSQVTFQVPGEGNARLENTARLSDDGQTLRGKTVVTGSTLSASGTFEYGWVARRMR